MLCLMVNIIFNKIINISKILHIRKSNIQYTVELNNK